MARIPQYNRSVTPQNTPKPYIQSYASPEAFGVNVSRAAENFTNARMNLLDNIATLKANYDKAKLLEFSNNIDRWAQENLYDTEKGYFYKTGKEAMGKSPEIMESYDKFADDYISKAGFVAGWEGQARQIAQSKKLTIERGVQAHDKKQSDAWMESVYMDGLSSVFARAVQSRNNPNDLDMFYKDGMTIIDNYAAVKGWDKDPETLGMKKKEFEAGYHKQILDAYLAEGSLKASEYFEKYKDKMPSNMQTAYLAKITNQKINYIARTNAEKLTGLSPDEAYKFIDNIENIDERDATEREYNRKIREEENIKNKIEKDTLDNFYTKVLEKTQKGENLSYDDIPANLDSQTKLGLIKYVAANGKPENDDETWEMLYQKSVSDAQGFANLDLNKYRGYLSESEYKSFLKRQNDIKTGDFYTQIKDDDKKISDALDAMGLKSNKKQASAFSEIKAMTKELETRKGRKITDNELLNITNSLGYKGQDGVQLYKRLEQGMAKRTGFIRDVVNDFTYYQNKHNGQMPSDEEKYKIILRRVEQEQQQRKNEAEQIISSYSSTANLMKNISDITPKTNEQKVLTYFADTQIPQLSKELGFNLTVTSRYRVPNGKYKSYHSEGRAADVSMSEHNSQNRIRAIEKILRLPTVYKIGTSDPILLAHFSGNNKLVDETNFDKKHGTNHKNHAHITLINYNPQGNTNVVAQGNIYKF